MSTSFRFAVLVSGILLSACAARVTPVIRLTEPPIGTLSSASAPTLPEDTALPTLTPILPADSITISIVEVPITVIFPIGYRLVKSKEANRRGSFISYDFIPSNGYQTPYLAEIQFFSSKSIAEFTQSCTGANPCFFGDFPDVERYDGQLKAYKEATSFEDFKLRQIGDRYYFISRHPCEGDTCVIREYTTFLSDETKVDIWIIMEDESQIQQSDMLFLLFHLQE